ncbi:hypothetical protein JW916_12740 [Candidatus Sumerlaeota bacterium]|nr:hypothetical protein [Candidatus Sumerlaeota bacterium]
MIRISLQRGGKGAKAFLVFMVLLLCAAAQADAPIGWASVNAMGQNGTTGGAGGTTVTVTTAVDLADYATRTGPYVIQVSGTITLPDRVDVASDKTFWGIGSNPTIATTMPDDNDAVLRAKGTHNLIFRNLIFRQDSAVSEELDGIALTRDSEGNFANHVWIDHCEFSNWVDGCIDITHASDYVTVSWCIFHDTALRGTLLGHSDTSTAIAEDTGHLTVTYHHNWFRTPQRNPRVRLSLLCHVFNNYYDGCSLYGVVSATDAEVLVEGCYFEDVPHPTYTGYESSPPGDLVERFNVYYYSPGYPPEPIWPPETRGTVPEPSAYYPYSLRSASDVPAKVTAYAGVGKLDLNTDHTPPGPDPMTWATPPHATGVSSIAMTASTATDAEGGVEYYFSNLTDPSHDSGWQSDPSYSDEGLSLATLYAYTVKARDVSFDLNETAPSDSQSARTYSAPAGVSDGKWTIY